MRPNDKAIGLRDLVDGLLFSLQAEGNIENYLYLAVTAFGVFTVVKATSAFMIVLGLALGTTGYALRSLARE